MKELKREGENSNYHNCLYSNAKVEKPETGSLLEVFPLDKYPGIIASPSDQPLGTY